MSETHAPARGLVEGMKSAPWRHWLRQTLAVVRFEVRKGMAGRRWLAVLLLAGGPVFLLTLRLILDGTDRALDAAAEGLVFAAIFQSYILRLSIFLGCVIVFSQLFRGEILERTLHYYLLSPVRREIVMAGKYLAGLLHVSIFFVAGTAAAYLLMFMPYGQRAMEAHFSDGVGASHMVAYAGVAFLACAGYGAVFLLTGLLSRNPILPAFFIAGWESLNIFLPAALQKVSIIHYLQSICPVPLPYGPLAVITEPTSPWVSVPGMLVMTAVILAVAAWRMRRAEVAYTTD